MKKYLKSYHVFLASPVIRVVLYLLYPLLITACSCLITLIIGSSLGHGMYGLLTAGSLIISAELFLDTFVYGGILAKDTNKLEYLKTSKKGIGVLERSLLMDKVRRILTAALISGITYAVCNEQVSVGQLIGFVFVTGALMELALLVTRHFNMISWTILAMTLVNIVEIVLGRIVIYLPSVCAIAFLIVFVLVVIGSSKLIMKKAENGFYDRVS